MRGDRVFAYLGVMLGLAASLGANVLHVLDGPDPDPWAVAGAAFWPLALLVSSEVLARKRWASSSSRVAGVVGVLVVALVAAWISYGHVHDLLVSWGEPAVAAALGPLAIDGLMVVSSLALVAQDAPPLLVPAALVEDAPPVPPVVSSTAEEPDTARPPRPVAVPSTRRRRPSGAGARSDEQLAARLVSDGMVGASQRHVATTLRVSQARAGRILGIARQHAGAREAS